MDASLHYAARLIEAGDLPSLARRLTVIAYEDIGLANPEAQIHTVTALDAAQKIGFPEARILIANVVIDLALSPKSNSAYVAMDKALTDLKTSGTCLFRDTYVMGTTVEARNWGMPKTISIHTTILEIGSSKTICQKKFVIITISKQKILVNMNGLWLKERKLSTVCEKSEILFKKLHFPLDFF
ncbi:recombination factor protein RarA [Streptococcus pneumoniae 1542]|nr:recombination factor protein RarA [Streptococcus pneumoniae 1542]